MEDSVEEEETVEGKGENQSDAEEFAVEALPPEVKRRVKALKKIQVAVTKIEAQFYAEMHALECKYLPQYQPYFEKRLEIISGKYEPTEEECDFVGGSDSEAEMAETVAAIKLGESETEPKEKVPGIPDFWLTIFRNVEMLADMTEPADEPILKHLKDIKVKMNNEPMGFTLEFHFSPNEYFTNEVLTKTYEMKCELEEDSPFSFEGPEIVKCTGCHIDWKKGKNVTVKMIRKKQKHKQKGSIRTVNKPVDVPSFFNFFSPPQVPDDPENELDDETQMRLTNDFESGQYIRERIVPRAVLYYTGEALDDDYEEEEEEEEGEEKPRINSGSENYFLLCILKVINCSCRSTSKFKNI
ncbi:unnamed protein product [Allacma fusca]|uniref:Nucleosome assembly protein 1-like 1 n=1 Tax=Allacma fusca TaxID=39272 RepID=A0A8J2JAN3_9HEXA|nr:unnamed protein product [Allacma fusca]